MLFFFWGGGVVSLPVDRHTKSDVICFEVVLLRKPRPPPLLSVGQSVLKS